jgi:predicted nicotinamide N-methyase
MAGDWEEVASQLTSDSTSKYTLILTSETIYNEKNYRKLVNLFKASLASEGEVYVAGKRVYFGVGGGMRSFEEYLESEGTFESTVVHVVDESVPREILRLRFKSKASPNSC